MTDINPIVRDHVEAIAQRIRDMDGYKSQFVSAVGKFDLPAQYLDEVWRTIGKSELVETQHLTITEVASVEDRADQLEFEFRSESLARKRIRDIGVGKIIGALPGVMTPDEMAAASKDTPKMRIADLLPDSANLLLCAANKCGKTERLIEVNDSLLTGNPFLDEFEVATPLDGNVLYLNYEVNGAQFSEWQQDMAITNKRFLTINLRDYATVPILSDGGAEWLVNMCVMHDAQVLVIDPAGRAMTAAGCKDENSNDEIKQFTSRLDEIKAQANLHHMILGIHANREHFPVRPRGADAWGGWFDVQVSMRLKNKGDLGGPRLFSAYGRDVEVPEQELDRDVSTRRCTIKPLPSKKGAEDLDEETLSVAMRRQKLTDNDYDRRVARYMRNHPDATQNQCEKNVEGTVTEVRKAFKRYQAEHPKDEE